MSRIQKEKLETHTEITFQAVPKVSREESTVAAAYGCDSKSNQEKRKKEADKPLYFKRV